MTELPHHHPSEAYQSTAYALDDSAGAQLTKKRILIIRHGQTDWNAAGRWQGMAQIPLNQVGIAQADALAEHLKDRPITAVYTSDLSRAKETADRIAERHQLSPHADPRWRELNMGAFQGLTYAEIVAKYPEEARSMKQDYMGFSAPEGETRRQLQSRVYEAYLDIVKQEKGPEIAVVTHGGTIRVLLLKLFEGHEEANVPIENTSITIIETDGIEHHLIGAASVEHLSEQRPESVQKDDISAP